MLKLVKSTKSHTNDKISQTLKQFIILLRTVRFELSHLMTCGFSLIRFRAIRFNVHTFIWRSNNIWLTQVFINPFSCTCVDKCVTFYVFLKWNTIVRVIISSRWLRPVCVSIDIMWSLADMCSVMYVLYCMMHNKRRLLTQLQYIFAYTHCCVL